MALLLFSLFGDKLEELLRSLFGRFTSSSDTVNLLTMLVFQGIFIAIVVAGYAVSPSSIRARRRLGVLE
ncbi:MAG: hypothetical protein HZY76_08525 [Anaerolineae bacterium]|nr:MAG: hypothetical protein HZY76_08525 [Anaerolineae bacterium]